MKRINLLDKHTINQIAAGEVIERPASVVKELLENSIDAKATKIEITISNECRNIRVADNGTGIHPDDIELAFVKHATSKISTGNDLYNINSLGFRGEALASIISVAKVTATSRTKDYDYGYKVECENSEVAKSQTGCAVGTIIEVKDLFYNLPVRMKFLKSQSVEFSYICEIAQQIALSNPNVSIVLKHNESEHLRTTGSGDLKTAITEIYSTSFLDKLKPIQKTDLLCDMKVSGYCTTPDFTRSNRKGMITFINGRVVKCQVLNKAIETAFKSMIPLKRYPFAIINLQIKNSDVDINVHPQKKEVRYKITNQVFGLVTSAISNAIETNTHVEQMPTQENTNIVSLFSKNNNTNSDDDAEWIMVDITQKPAIVQEKLQLNQNSFFDENNNLNIPEVEQVSAPDYRIIGQYKKSYILVECEDSLVIIDQHIADERARYEQLMNETHNESQVLLFSDVIELDAEDAELIKEKLPELEKIGYEFKFENETSLVIKKIPQVVSHVPVKELFTDVLSALKDTSARSFYENMLTSVACKASVKAGEELNLWQMQNIIKRWEVTDVPYTCPHGRPIMKEIPHSELASYFLRNK